MGGKTFLSFLGALRGGLIHSMRVSLREERGGRAKEGGMGSYSRSSRMFLRGLGVVYACLFYSLFSQWPGLYGCDGIQPMVTVMHRSIAHLPAGSSWWAAFTRLPSLLWLVVGSELSASQQRFSAFWDLVWQSPKCFLVAPSSFGPPVCYG
jgi:hypothetical protein